MLPVSVWVALIGLAFVAIGNVVIVTAYIVMTRTNVQNLKENLIDHKKEFSKHETECREDRAEMWKTIHTKADKK